MKSLVVVLFVATLFLWKADCARFKPECSGTFLACPEDCTKYYLCLRGRLRIMPCPDGLHWNNKRKFCDDPANANCKEIPKGSDVPKPTEPVIPDTTTTTTTTTTKPMPVTEPITESTTFEPITTVAPPTREEMKIICYFTNWAWHRLREGKYVPENIDPNLCTHIIFAYAALDPEELIIKASNPYTDIETILLYKRVTILRENGVKVLIGLGGLSDTVGDKYERLLADENNSRKFVASVMAFIYKYEFDGLEIEYPACFQNDCGSKNPQTKQGFSQLIGDLSKAFKPNGWLLSASVSANPAGIDANYDVPQFNRYLDWISLMTYDYYSSYDGRTEHIAPLFTSNDYNIDSTVKYWIQRGIPSYKIVLGISSAGLSFTLENSENHTFGATTRGAGNHGPLSNIPGSLAYYEICNNTKHNGWTVVRDSENKIGPYAYHGDQWVSYDDVENIRAKAKYIRDMDLSGGMLWTLDYDDFRGSCGCGEYPLLAALNRELRDGEFNGEVNDNCT